MNTSNNKGFTLLETICAMALFLEVVLLVGSMFIIAQQTYRQGAGQGELIQNARVCLDRLSRELRQSDYLVTDISSTSTPANEIFFQNGHDSSDINYIRYYLDGTDLRRERSVYFFSSDPAVYVYYNSVNAFGNPPTPQVLRDEVIGEYFNQIAFYGEQGLVNIDFNLAKQKNDLTISTKAYIRNR